MIYFKNNKLLEYNGTKYNCKINKDAWTNIQKKCIGLFNNENYNIIIKNGCNSNLKENTNYIYYECKPLQKEYIKLIKNNDEEQNKSLILPPNAENISLDYIKLINSYYKKKGNIKIKTIGKIDINYDDFNRLKDKTWLNDDIINSYFYIITKNNKKFTYFNSNSLQSIFREKYIEKKSDNYINDRIDRMINRNNKWKEKENILIPFNINNYHWILFHANIKNRKIDVYDSYKVNDEKLDTSIHEYLQFLKYFLKRMYDDKLILKINNNYVSNISQQIDGCSCGVFCCQFARYLIQGMPINFENKHIPYFRYEMARDLLLSDV